MRSNRVLGSSDRIEPEDLPETVFQPGAAADEVATNRHQAVEAAKKRMVFDAVGRAAGEMEKRRGGSECIRSTSTA